MAATKTLKATDRHNIVKKLTGELKKRYRSSWPKTQRPVLETLLFAACLEDASWEAAEQSFQRMLASFYDLNEIRVSSVSEIEQALGELPDAAWKALRIRETLQYTFENHFSFDLDAIRRKSQDAAIKELSAIPYQTHFMRQYALVQCLGAHLIPVDQRMRSALIWLGLADPSQSAEELAEELKLATKKTDGPLVFHLLKSLSVDHEFRDLFAADSRNRDDRDPFQAPNRLSDLFSGKLKKARKPKPAKTVSRKKPKSAGGTARKPAPKETAKKVTKKKPPAPPVKRNTKRPK